MFRSFNFFVRPWENHFDLQANRFFFHLMTQLGSSSQLLVTWRYSKIDRRYPRYRINSSTDLSSYVSLQSLSLSLSPISFIISSKYVSFFSLFLSKSSFGRGEGEQPSLDRAVITKLLPALYIPDIFEPRDRSLESNHVNNHPFQKLATRKKTNSHLATSTPFPPRRYARGMMPTSRFQSLSFSRCRLPHARRMQSYIDASNRSVTRNNLCGEAHASVSIINGTHRWIDASNNYTATIDARFPIRSRQTATDTRLIDDLIRHGKLN